MVAEGTELIGVSAVIDKDFASEKMGEIVEADYLFILTAVAKEALTGQSDTIVYCE